jgi:hypothetical protein
MMLACITQNGGATYGNPGIGFMTTLGISYGNRFIYACSVASGSICLTGASVLYNPPRAIAHKSIRIIICGLSRESKLVRMFSYTKCALRYLTGCMDTYFMLSPHLK